MLWKVNTTISYTYYTYIYRHHPQIIKMFTFNGSIVLKCIIYLFCVDAIKHTWSSQKNRDSSLKKLGHGCIVRILGTYSYKLWQGDLVAAEGPKGTRAVPWWEMEGRGDQWQINISEFWDPSVTNSEHMLNFKMKFHT